MNTNLNTLRSHDNEQLNKLQKNKKLHVITLKTTLSSMSEKVHSSCVTSLFILTYKFKLQVKISIQNSITFTFEISRHTFCIPKARQTMIHMYKQAFSTKIMVFIYCLPLRNLNVNKHT